MRFLKHVSLLAVALPLALAGYGPPPAETTCVVGAYRCNNNTLQSCGRDANWKTIEQCSKLAYCSTQLTPKGTGGCFPVTKGDTKHCSTVGAYQCGNNTVQMCGEDGYWKTTKQCTKTALCLLQNVVTGKVDCTPMVINNNQCSVANVTRCNNNTLESCGTDGYWKTTKECTKTAYCFAQDTTKGNGDCYALTSGDEQCSVANISRCTNNTLQTCGASGYWKMAKKCTKTALCFTQPQMADGGDCQALVPEPKQCSVASVHRCSDDNSTSTLEVCGNHGYWEKVKDCAESEKCLLDSSSADGGLCTPLLDNGAKDHGNSTTHRCRDNKIENLTAGKQWTLQTACAENEACKDECTPDGCKASCIKKTDLFPTDPCIPGTLQCELDATSVLTCTQNRFWDVQTWCSKTEKCTTHPNGKVHCMSTNITAPHDPKPTTPYAVPPNTGPLPSKRDQQCHPGDKACDTDRRFLFTCAKDGTWSTPTQCFGPGYCRPDNGFPLTCGGFPTYEGQNDKCNDHCEGFDYLYCVGSNWHKPEFVQRCFENMCGLKDCAACDRCTYQAPYGGVVPDLSTLVRAET